MRNITSYRMKSSVHNAHSYNLKEEKQMKTFYQMSGEDTMKQLNGSAEPLTESQVKEHQEKIRSE